MAYKLFKPRRGTKKYMDTSGIVLAKGELFFEVPDTGVGTGTCNIKMGDGTTTYDNLPYAISGSGGVSDVSTAEVTFVASSTASNSDLLDEITSGKTVSTLFGSIKALLTNLNTSVNTLDSEYSSLNSDLGNYALKTALTDGSVTKVGTSTVGGTAKPIYLSSGTPTACSDTVGAAGKPVFMSSGTITACSSTIGSASQPVYMSSGTITACSSTVGAAGKPIYSNGGVLTACSSTIGSSTQPVYLSSGTITTCTVNSTYGGVLISRSNDGVCEMGKYFDFHTSSDSTADYDCRLYANGTSLYINNPNNSSGLIVIGASKGGTNQPVYTNSDGLAVACNTMMALSGNTFTGQAYAYTNTNYSTYQLRNIAFTTSTPSSLTNGNVCMVYS